MNPFLGFSSASSGPQAGLPHNQSRQIGHPPNLMPTACKDVSCNSKPFISMRQAKRFIPKDWYYCQFSTLGGQTFVFGNLSNLYEKEKVFRMNF